MKHKLLLAAALLFAAAAAAQNNAAVLLFDDFDSADATPNPEVWEPCRYEYSVWARYFNDALPYAGVRVENGFLKLSAYKSGGRYVTGGIKTRHGFPVNTRVDVAAIITKPVKGGFPAIWQMPVHGKPWPRSGEIDIMEWVHPTEKTVFQTVHTYYALENTGASATTHPTHNFDVTAEHIYSVVRTETAVTFLIDGQQLWTYDNLGLGGTEEQLQYPFAEGDFNLILNYSLGGKFNGKMSWPGPVDNSQLPGEMWINWVSISALQP